MEIGKVLDKISAQQPKERSAVWMVGEQLKDMVRAEPGIADIILSRSGLNTSAISG